MSAYYPKVAEILGALRMAISRHEKTPEVRKAIFERLVEAAGLPLAVAPITTDPW